MPENSWPEYRFNRSSTRCCCSGVNILGARIRRITSSACPPANVSITTPSVMSRVANILPQNLRSWSIAPADKRNSHHSKTQIWTISAVRPAISKLSPKCLQRNQWFRSTSSDWGTAYYDERAEASASYHASAVCYCFAKNIGFTAIVDPLGSTAS